MPEEATKGGKGPDEPAPFEEKLEETRAVDQEASRLQLIQSSRDHGCPRVLGMELAIAASMDEIDDGRTNILGLVAEN